MNDALPESPRTAAAMADAASRFLAALTDAQRVTWPSVLLGPRGVLVLTTCN